MRLDPQPLDLLLIVDNSCSMEPDQGIDILAHQRTAAAALRSDEDLAQPHRLE